MMTLIQMLKLTPTIVQKSTKNTRILEAKMSKGKIGGTKKLSMKIKRTTSDGRKHGTYRVTVEGVDPKRTKLSEGYVKVSCACAAFTYWGIEYVLHQKKAADIKHSDGSAPNIRNPALRIFLCPHLTKAAQSIIRQGV